MRPQSSCCAVKLVRIINAACCHWPLLEVQHFNSTAVTAYCQNWWALRVPGIPGNAVGVSKVVGCCRSQNPYFWKWMNRFWYKLADVGSTRQGHKTVNFRDQEMKVQSHTRPKLDLEAWRRHHSRPPSFNMLLPVHLSSKTSCFTENWENVYKVCSIKKIN